MKIKKESLSLPVIFGCFMLFSYIVMKFICRGKYEFLHIISAKTAFPPMWVFNLLFIIGLFFLGVAAGFFLNSLIENKFSIQIENLILRGFVLLVAIYFLSLLWYPFLFVMQMPIFSYIFSLMAVIMSVLLLIFWIKACSAYSFFIIPFLLWSVYLNILNFFIIFTI